jgi:hypothetical protein
MQLKWGESLIRAESATTRIWRAGHRFFFCGIVARSREYWINYGVKLRQSKWFGKPTGLKLNPNHRMRSESSCEGHEAERCRVKAMRPLLCEGQEAEPESFGAVNDKMEKWMENDTASACLVTEKWMENDTASACLVILTRSDAASTCRFG